MELTGTLDCFPLRELLELMQDSSMCGLLQIEGSRGAGYIGAKDGFICHAAYADQIGHEALWLLFEETDASFTVAADRSMKVPQTLIGDATMLSDEGEGRARLWREIRPFVPDTRLIPVATPGASSARLQDAFDRTVFEALDGRSTVDDLVFPTALSLLDICRSLARMISVGMVRLVQSPAVAAQVVSEAPARPSEPQSGGLFRRPLGAAIPDNAPKTGLLGRLSQAQQRG
jgi:hypothetical protein